jgi:glycosyltransferase involved in cell wall biosynthesis
MHMAHTETSRAATTRGSEVRSRAHAPRIAILTNVLPSYRRGFYDRLFARQDLMATVYCQKAIPGTNVEPIHDRYPDRITLVRSFGWKGEALAWQLTPWRELLEYDVVVVDGNPRVLSHAVTATLLRLLRRNVVLWTMGHSYRANALTERIRLLWTRMFNRLLVYTDAEVRFLRTQGFASQHIVSMNNGLDQVEIDTAMAAWSEPRLGQWRRAQHLPDGPILLSCARLDPKNRFEQVIAALPAVLDQAPDTVWCVIGGGADEQRLTECAREAGLADRVRFVGELYDEDQLAPWFLSAAVFAYPVAIGLSILHAFGYGVPVVTSDDIASHNPEIEALRPNQNGLRYRDGDIDDFAAAITRLLTNQETWQSMSEAARATVAGPEGFTINRMVQGFVDAVRFVTKR